MKKAKRIDIHVHTTVFPEFSPECKWGGRFLTPEEHMSNFDEIDIERGVILPIVSPEGQIQPLTNETAKLTADKYPDRFFWFCNIDPRFVSNSSSSDFRPLIAHYKALGAKGVGEITCNLYVDDPKVESLFSACEELDMPVLFHIGPHKGNCYGLIDDLGLPRFEKAIKSYPNLKFIGHSQPFWSEMSLDNTNETRNDFPKTKIKEGRIIELLRKYPNLYCDLSANSGSNALMRDEEYAVKFVEEFSDRLMYGCDVCARNNTHHYEFDQFLNRMVDEGKFRVEIYNKIVRENAIRILKLDI